MYSFYGNWPRKEVIVMDPAQVFAALIATPPLDQCPLGGKATLTTWKGTDPDD